MSDYPTNKYDLPPRDDKFQRLNNQVDGLKNTLRDNIHLAIDRGDQLEELEDRSSTLEENSRTFASQSTRVKRMMWLRSVKFWILIAVIVAVIIVIVYFTVKKD